MRHKPQGFSNLVLVLVITGALVSLGLFLNQRIRSSSITQTIVVSRNQAGSAAESCLLEAALRLGRNRSYVGGQLNQSPIFCTMSIARQGTTYTITAIGTSGTTTRTMTLTLSDATGALIPKHFTELP